MVAEDGEPLRDLELGDDLGSETGSTLTDAARTRATADEVAGEEDEVGLKRVDAMNDVPEVRSLGVLEEVDVRDLCDPHADEGVRKIANGEGAMGDLKLVAGVCAGVEAYTEGGSAGAGEEGSSREVLGGGGGVLNVLGREFGDGHSPL
jgi:hypothetical protein